MTRGTIKAGARRMASLRRSEGGLLRATLGVHGRPRIQAARGGIGILRTIGLLGGALACGLLAIGCGAPKQSTLERIRSTKVLSIGTDATYPPFETVDPESGEVVGFDVEIMKRLAASLGATAKFQAVNFDGIIAGLKTWKYDAVISAMTITPERAAQVAFTHPYSAAGQSIAVRAAEMAVLGVPELTGKRIGVQLGTTGELEAKKVPQAEVRSFDAIGNAFRDLENGNVDAVIADTPTARIFQRQHGTIKLVGAPLTHEEYGIALRLEDADLKAALDAELMRLRDSGELHALEVQWGFAE